MIKEQEESDWNVACTTSLRVRAFIVFPSTVHIELVIRVDFQDIEPVMYLTGYHALNSSSYSEIFATLLNERHGQDTDHDHGPPAWKFDLI